MKSVGIIGATGYVGGRLLSKLQAEHFPITCLARTPEFLIPRVSPSTRVVKADVLDRSSLIEALKDVHTAYYLVHSMGAVRSFEELDREGARNFSEACRSAGVQQIIYLGGLGGGSALSPHLRSRQEVGEIFRSSPVPTIEFRSSVILGSGSLSFELIRHLVEKLPIMVAPKWVRTRTQPISVEDVIEYLMHALDCDPPRTRLYEIGGPDVVAYEDLLREYAGQRNLKRWILPVPVLSPKVSSLWLGLFTPLFARIGRKLVDSLKNPTVVEDSSALSDFSVRPKPIREAIARALIHEDRKFAETRWMDALSSKGFLRRLDPARLGPRNISWIARRAKCRPDKVFAVISRIGGEQGYYSADFLWRIRGAIDLLVGGVGFRRGRPHPTELKVGDTVDFWRVEACESPRVLRLRAEMKLPGRAWLQFEVKESGDGAEVLQTAIFDPLGVSGRNYWYLLLPLHWVIFHGMLRAIVKTAEKE